MSALDTPVAELTSKHLYASADRRRPCNSNSSDCFYEDIFNIPWHILKQHSGSHRQHLRLLKSRSSSIQIFQITIKNHSLKSTNYIIFVYYSTCKQYLLSFLYTRIVLHSFLCCHLLTTQEWHYFFFYELSFMKISACILAVSLQYCSFGRIK